MSAVLDRNTQHHYFLVRDLGSQHATRNTMSAVIDRSWLPVGGRSAHLLNCHGFGSRGHAERHAAVARHVLSRTRAKTVTSNAGSAN